MLAMLSPLPPAGVSDLLGQAPRRIQPLDPRGQPWLVVGADGAPAVLRRFPPGPYPPATSLPHVTWLHRFLDRLATHGFPAPRPLPLLGGVSIASIDGALWETVSFLPGQPLGWNPCVPLASAGALLAHLHRLSLSISPADQRPGALPMEDCHPACAAALADAFQRELVMVGHASAARCVVHGDCTAANMLVNDQHTVSAMIDFTLAHLGPPESDISFALWVTGRTEQPAIALDMERVRAFVAGYHQVRPLGDWAVRAIPLYLVGRGLQMLVRLERFGRTDETQLARTHWLHQHRPWLEDTIASALMAPHPAQ
jgi:Ser/Thr protein kinase RdoA (MazF antagonist)